jgi:hypothetical protein
MSPLTSPRGGHSDDSPPVSPSTPQTKKHQQRRVPTKTPIGKSEKPKKKVPKPQSDRKKSTGEAALTLMERTLIMEAIQKLSSGSPTREEQRVRKKKKRSLEKVTEERKKFENMLSYNFQELARLLETRNINIHSLSWAPSELLKILPPETKVPIFLPSKKLKSIPLKLIEFQSDPDDISPSFSVAKRIHDCAVSFVNAAMKIIPIFEVVDSGGNPFPEIPTENGFSTSDWSRSPKSKYRKPKLASEEERKDSEEGIESPAKGKRTKKGDSGKLNLKRSHSRNKKDAVLDNSDSEENVPESGERSSTPKYGKKKPRSREDSTGNINSDRNSGKKVGRSSDNSVKRKIDVEPEPEKPKKKRSKDDSERSTITTSGSIPKNESLNSSANQSKKNSTDSGSDVEVSGGSSSSDSEFESTKKTEPTTPTMQRRKPKNQKRIIDESDVFLESSSESQSEGIYLILRNL